MRAPKKLADENALYDYAVRALGRRMRSVAELKRLLRARVLPGGEALIEAVVSRLKEQRYLNDAAYAAAYAGFRRDNEKLGRRRVANDLKARGVHPEIADKALNDAYCESDEMRLARDFLLRKRVARPQDDRAAARIFRMLMRAGFGTRTAIHVLKKWQVADETLSLLEGEAE